MQFENKKRSKANRQGDTDTSLKKRTSLFEFYKLKADTILRLLLLAYTVTFSAGAVLASIYFFRNQFNPGGLSAADTVLFALVAFGFTILIAIILVYSTFAAFPLARLLHFIFLSGRRIMKMIKQRQKNASNINAAKNELGAPVTFAWKKGNGFVLFGGSLTLLIFVLQIIFLPNGIKTFLLVMLAGGIGVSMLAFGNYEHHYCPWTPDKKYWAADLWLRKLSQKKRQLLITFIVMLSLLLLVFGTAQDASIRFVGLQKRNVAVRLKKDDFKLFVQRATRLGVAVNPCESIDADTTLATKVDVLWHKLGSQGLLRFPSQRLGAEHPDERPIQEMRLELANTSFSVVEEKTPKDRCEEFLSDRLFDASGENLSVAGKKMLAHDLGWLEDVPEDRKIIIAAYSSAPSLDSQNKPNTVTLRQAAAIRNFLFSQFSVKSSLFEITGMENTTPKQECASIPSIIAKRSCEEMNRRVEIRSSHSI